MRDQSIPNSTVETIPYGYCQCGCGERTTIASRNQPDFGWVKGEPKRFIRFHHHRARERSADYEVDTQTGCWNWIKKIDRDGYGHTSIKHVDYRAARVYFETHKHAIPDGMVVDHLCRNRRCVNPDHLEVVTVLENTRRGNSTKLTPDSVRKIRRLISTGRYTHAEISQIVGIASSTVSQIRTGKKWADVTG